MMNVSPSVVYFGINEHLTLSKEGVWLSNGEEITHEATVQAFFRFLDQDPNSQWWVRIGNEQKPVSIEDTPSFVRRIAGSPQQGYRITLLGDEEGVSQELDISTLTYHPGRLTCRTQKGWEARFLRVPYYELLKELQHDELGYFIWIRGKRVSLAKS